MKKNVALVFPGQGSQAVGMGRDLYDNFTIAREVFEQLDDILKIKLSRIIFEGPVEELTKTENTQPALMAVSIAIIKILEKDFGKKVTDIAGLVAGHSLGEYSALCAANALSLEQTAKLLQIRGQAMSHCGKKTAGAMAAIIGADLELITKVVEEVASGGEICQIANDNSIGQVVISGSKVGVENAIEIARKNGIKRVILLPVSGAFHSMLMQNAAKDMEAALHDVAFNSPIVPLVANVTANIVNDSQEIKKLLVQQVTGSVRWRETMLFMEKYGITEIIEIGSGKVLANLVGRTCPSLSSKSIQNVSDIKSFVEG